MMPMHFLSLGDFAREQLEEILAMAAEPGDGGADLRGKTAVLFFPESSIRTRISFEKAVADLGGRIILFPPSALDKEEDLRDVAGYLANWADLVIVRHRDLERVRELARFCPVPVINAMTSTNHPCEILSDIRAIGRLRKDFRSLSYCFVGPRGNILQSWVNAARVFGFTLIHAADPGERAARDDASYRLSEDLDRILGRSDVLLTDSLPERYRTDDYYARFRISAERIGKLPPGALFNPCPPFGRGRELSDDALETPAFVGYGFKKALVPVQKAIIRYCLSGVAG